MVNRAGVPAGLEPRPMSGHFWTLVGYLRNVVKPPVAPASQRFEATVRDPEIGSLLLTGRLSEVGTARLIIVLHGIAGSAESAYSVRTAAAAVGAGLSCLRLNLRGADRTGEDIFHAGLTADLHAALASPDLARFRSVHVLGFSLGGHVTLRFATEPADPRLRSVAAICSPLDLATCVAAFDRPLSALYRRRILRELSNAFGRVAARREVASSPLRVRRAHSLREFDGLTVVPRFGFDDADDYYSKASVGPVLDRLRVPALLVAGVSDPLVPLATLMPFLEPMPSKLEVRYADPGGHVGFPARLRLGVEAPDGLESQVLGWLIGAARG